MPVLTNVSGTTPSGSHAQSHSSTAQVTIGPMSSFYKTDPKGRPSNVVLVSPWINTVNGKVWLPQGDSYPGGFTTDTVAIRWWQEVTNTYGIGALGVRSKTSSPSYGT